MYKVKSYDAYDGALYAEESTNNTVKYLDLSVPVYHLPLYDWVFSIEVAEHIPKTYEQIYINNLVRHASHGIILSWAVPKQEGHGHVNNQDFSYIEEQLIKEL
jgi:cyclopropane fatty-acyl-phospholipid synthase-like methyltransferase